MIIGISMKFDAAHYLPSYKGKCKEMHGHTWHVEVELEGEVDPVTGMVMDLNLLKKIVNQLIEVLDHELLNNVVSNPTCENLVTYFSYNLYKFFPGYLVRVKIKEGDGGWARTSD